MAYKVVYDKSGCIGAGECELVDAKNWEVGSDGLATLKAGTKTSGQCMEITITDEEVKKQQQVAQSCPGGCIKIVKC